MAERKFVDLELERHLAGELRRDFEREASDADRARLAELRAEHETFLRETDVAAEVAAIHRRAARHAPEPRAPWFRWLVPVGALAAAAVVMLVLWRRTPVDDDLQLKGDGVTLVIYMQTDANSKKLASNDTVAAGAHIRFQVTAGKRGYVAVIGVDPKTATVYVSPYAYEGGLCLLPGAIELDDTPGDERFYAVFASEPFTADAAMAALRDHRALPDGVARSSEVVLHKASR